MGKEKTSAKVLNKDGIFVREYTLKMHGKNFLALAKEFATKNGYTVVQGDKEVDEALEAPEATPEANTDGEENEELDLTKLSFAELKSLADENDIDYNGVKSKTGLIELLEK